ncbi:MAG: DctP family TRAP transporter solute-binding subunit [Paracoccaceae bacterium]
MTFHRLIRAAAATAALLGTTLPAGAETVLKLGHFGPGPDPFSKSVEAFAAKVEELSGGDLKIQIFPAGQLGNEKQQISALQGGLQEMLVTSSTNLSNMKSELALLDLPFVFSNYAEADAVTMGPVGAEMLDGLEGNGMIGMALWENGFRALSNSQRNVETPEDMKGLKIRVIGAPVFIDTFSALGTNPVPMPFPELYSAMETGTVDGQDNPALTDMVLKFYEVQKYYTATNHMYGAMVVLGSKAALGRLTNEQRAILEKAAQDFGPEQRVFLRDAETMAMDYLENEGGMTVVRSLSPEAVAAFREATASVAEKAVTDDLRPLYDEMKAAISAAN